MDLGLGLGLFPTETCLRPRESFRTGLEDLLWDLERVLMELTEGGLGRRTRRLYLVVVHFIPTCH